MKDGSKSELIDGGSMPLHTYLQRRMKQLPDLTNVMVAQALGYPRPNVVAMMMTGDMKVPLSKVQDLARVLELDPPALLRRALSEYAPEILSTVESTLGPDSLMSLNEAEFLRFIREQLAGNDVAMLADAECREQLARALMSAHERHVRQLLATRSDEVVNRAGASGRAGDAMLALLRKQAAERASMLRELKEQIK